MEYNHCPRCAAGFNSVAASMLTLFQTVVAGDSWGQIGVPLIEHHPSLAPLFVAVVVTVSLGGMNLILAVIVDCAAEARENDLHRKTAERKKATEKGRQELLKLFYELDKDRSGTLSR